jgi:aspartokinase
MIKISESVREIIENDVSALEVLSRNQLNTSKYAIQIKEEVENSTKKSVRVGTIIVALNRLKRMYSNIKIKPIVEIDLISVKGNLLTVTFEKSLSHLSYLKKLYCRLRYEKFIAVTEGVTEVTFILNESGIEIITSDCNIKPKAQHNNLASVSLRFSKKYIYIPNTIYTLVSVLAANKINIIEIVSTYTELSFIISENEVFRAISALQNSSVIRIV